MFVQTEWCEDSLTFFKKCVQEASTLYFRKATDIFDQEIAFGDLVAKKPNGEIYEIGAKLCEFKFALAKNESGERFLHVFNRSLSAVIDRWDDNLRSQNILAQCDTLLVTEIAEPQAIEDTKIREMTIDLKEISHALEECTMVNNSIYRVNNWIKTRKNPRTAVLQSSNVSLPLTGVAALKPSSQIIGNYESKPLCPPSSKSVPVSPITQEHPVIHPPGHLSSTMYLDKNFDLSSDAKAQEPFFDKLGSKRHSSPPEQTKLLKNLADTQKEVDEKEKNKADSPPVEKQ